VKWVKGYHSNCLKIHNYKNNNEALPQIANCVWKWCLFRGGRIASPFWRPARARAFLLPQTFALFATQLHKGLHKQDNERGRAGESGGGFRYRTE
jgi:hypothetical protein